MIHNITEPLSLETFEVESCVRGHRIYKCVWTPVLGEELECLREDSNDHDPYAVAVTRQCNIIRHLPRRTSAACSLFLQKGGSIVYRITTSRRFSTDLPQGGLEVSLYFEVHGPVKLYCQSTKAFSSFKTCRNLQQVSCRTVSKCLV